MWSESYSAVKNSRSIDYYRTVWFYYFFSFSCKNVLFFRLRHVFFSRRVWCDFQGMKSGRVIIERERWVGWWLSGISSWDLTPGNKPHQMSEICSIITLHKRKSLVLYGNNMAFFIFMKLFLSCDESVLI